jgi:Ca2+-binding EF-hand superfamily protein
MSSTISSVGGYSSLMTQMMRHNTSKMAQDLFSQIDTSGKGYIEKSDLESAFQKLSSSSSSSSSSTSDQIFSSLDSNGDGKITQEEMTTGLQKLSDALDSQFQSMRMSEAMGGMGAMGGMPPPPPPQNDTGFTKDELQTQLDQIGGTDSKRSSLISNIVANFDEADTNGDGKVSFKEAMAYDQSSNSSSTTSSSSSSSSTSTSSSSTASEAKLMLTILQLVHAYQASATSSTTSGISTSA